jgi:hypothetical protein
MESEKLNKLRTFYHSLLEQQQSLSVLDTKMMYIDKKALTPLVNELIAVSEEFPDLLPPFNPSQYAVAMHSGGTSYHLVSIKTHTAMVIGRLKTIIEQPTNTPVTEQRQFRFINNVKLRTIIERDYSEIQRAYIAQCWKSVIILSGGSIEAILADLLKSNEKAAISAKSAPSETDIMRWDLSQLIKVAVELKLVSVGVEKLSQPLREYRNLVHPGNEIRNDLRFDSEEARIAIEVLNIVQRDLQN